jgi:hypothetical protein
MTEQECLDRMVAPGTPREGKYRRGVIQIHVTRACDKACFNCTQGSNYGGKPEFMPVEMFAQAVESLRGYFGVVGVFGGNPAMHPQFHELCTTLENSWVPWEQRGLWCNNPLTLGKAITMRECFNPAVSNLNVHLDQEAYNLFKQGWPECSPVGLAQDSRHSPVFVSMKDLNVPESKRWELISDCDINQHWSAMVGMFRGELRAWFCEVAGAQAMLHQNDPGYPDTGIPLLKPSGYGVFQRDESTSYIGPWWQQPISSFADQVRKHCHECGVPLRGYGELAMAEDGQEQVSVSHPFKSKRPGRRRQSVASLEQLGLGRLQQTTKYLQNASK